MSDRGDRGDATKPRGADEHLVAQVLADALQGRLPDGIAAAARFAEAARRVVPQRVAPLVLAQWVARDPGARSILAALRDSGGG